MKVFGLTGGIATGKSTVVEQLRALGAEVIDADVVAREVVAPGQPAFVEIGQAFPEVVKDGVLDRAALGERVFRNPEDRAALNAMTHPRVRAAVIEKLQALAAKGVPRVIYDAPLLIENRLYEGLDGVILVVAPPEVQLERLMARNQLTREQAQQRIGSQWPQDEKRRYATWVIDNGGSREQTRAQVEALWQELLKASPPHQVDSSAS